MAPKSHMKRLKPNKMKILLIVHFALLINICTKYSGKFVTDEKRVFSDTIKIHILSTYNCKYSLYLTDSTLIFQSSSEILTDTSDTVWHIDYQTFQTIIPNNEFIKLKNVLIDYKNAEPIIDTGEVRDGYIYELYLNNILLMHINNNSKPIDSLLFILRPFVDDSKIQCSNFWNQFDESKLKKN